MVGKGGAPVVLAALALLPWLADALKPPFEGHPWEGAACVIDFFQTTYYLGEAANGINEALLACPPATSGRKAVAACSLTVGATLAGFLQAAVAMATALSDCAETVDYGAACAADVLDVHANLAQAVDGTSAFVGGVCNQDGEPLQEAVRNESLKDLRASDLPEFEKYLFLRHKVKNYTRFVEERHEENLEQRVRAAQIATCTLSAGQASFFMVRIISALHFAVLDCPPNVTVDTETKLTCVVTVDGVFNALGNLVTYLALLVENCQLKQLFDCAAEVGTWIQVVTGLIQDGADFPLSCGHEQRPGQVVDLTNRRLSSSQPRAAEIFV